VIRRILRRGAVLAEREQELRDQERELIERLETAIQRFEPKEGARDVEHLRDARDQLDGLFLLVVAGEFNSGKSTFINALLGERVLPEGVTPTTDRINLLHYGDEPGEQLLAEYVLERTYPADLLREISLVDTPGTNAIIRRHEELTRDFVPRSDLVLFVTSADRPFTESERAVLQEIREWGKKIVMVLNKIDIIPRSEEREEVESYVRRNAAALLGREPEVFSLSSKQALDARAGAGDEEAWQASGFEAMEEYLLKTLDQRERVRLKLLNPLMVGVRLATKHKDEAFQRLKLLADDVETIQNIDRQLAHFHEEMLTDFEPRLAALDVLLQGVERRGAAFFDEMIRIGRIRSLLDSDGIRRAFENEVIGDLHQKIEEEVGRIIDWIVERNLKVWQDIQRYVEQRQISRHEGEMIGEVRKGFDYNRQALLGSVGRLARDVVGTYNREAEARAIANEVQGTFATTAMAEVGAIGLGAVIATVVSGVVWDVTGVLLAAALAVGGFYIIPRKRRQAKRNLERRVDQLRQQLRESLTRQIHQEIADASERINEGIAPYRRFVMTQQEKLDEARSELVSIESAFLRLREKIEKL
jgi:small GTP-binding protein